MISRELFDLQGPPDGPGRHRPLPAIDGLLAATALQHDLMLDQNAVQIHERI
jgi:hypothetical protein